MVAENGFCTFQTLVYTISAPSSFIHLFIQHIVTDVDPVLHLGQGPGMQELRVSASGRCS